MLLSTGLQRVGDDLATKQQQSFLSCGALGRLLSQPVNACGAVRNDRASAEKVASHRRDDVEGSLTMAQGLSPSQDTLQRNLLPAHS